MFSGFLNQTVTTNKNLCRLIEYDYSSNSIPGAGDNIKLAPSTPRRTIESVLGTEIRRTYFVALPSERREILCVNPGLAWNNSANLVTITKQFTNGFHIGEAKSISRPDGTVDVFWYGTPGTLTTNTVLTGHPDSSGTNIDSGTKTISVIDATGKLLSQTRIDVPSNITISQETYDYDTYKRLVRTAYLDGTSTTNSYGCCTLDSTVERDGTITTYTHDALKRQLTSTRCGITISNVLDAVGNILATKRYGTNGNLITLSEATFNDSGEQTSSRDALNNLTSYTNYVDGSGQRIRRTTYPDLTTREETYALDGSLLKTAGTAVRGIRYDYGVEAESTVQRFYSKEIKLNDAGSDTSEWTKTYTDGAGRAYKILYADNAFSQSYFNTKGQLQKQRDPDGVSTLFTNNIRNELDYTALDLDADDVIDFAGTDRITRTTNDVYFNAPLGINIRRTRTYVWGTASSNTSNLVSTIESSVDGLRSWKTVYRDASTPVTSSGRTFYLGNGLRNETNTAPDNSYTVSQFQFGRLVNVTRFDSTNGQIGRTSFSYDAHGRQSKVTDARNGTTTYAFNNADLVTSVTTPSPGFGQNAQTMLTFYNNRLQVTNSVAADGASTYFEFHPTGELKKTWGARTYPVQYSYDYAGRVKTMTNWSNFGTSSGARETTWSYDGQRGWLTNKTYASGATGPDYTYTAGGRLKKRTWARIGTLSKRIFATYTYGFEGANKYGDLVSVVYSQDPQNTPSTTYTYDRRGRRATAVRNSITTTFSYNDVDEMLSESYSGGTLAGLAVTNIFDTLLRRTTNNAWNGATRLAQTIYTYDAASRMQTVSDGTNNATYSFVPNSPLVSQITFKSNSVVRLTTTKASDYINRLESISSVAAGLTPSLTFAFQHNDANQRIRCTLADGSFWVYQYDSLGQVKSGKLYWSDWSPVPGQQFEYGHDDIGNRTSTKAGGDENGGYLRSATYSANSLNQLTNRTIPGAVDIVGIANATATVTVNGQGTYRKGEYYRNELTINNASAAQWQSVTNKAVEGTTTNTVIGNVYLAKTSEAFTYDLDGNLLSDGRWNYTWDAENQLVVAVVNSGVGTAQYLTFEYDYQGRRIGKQLWFNLTGSGAPATALKFLYDGWNQVALLSGSTLQQSFMWGLDLSGSEQGAGGVGGLLKVTHIGAQTTNAFVAFDGNGNVAGLVSAADGTMLALYEYGPFGEAIRASGVMAKVNSFRFSTKYTDDETDLSYYGYRYYNASTGRWLSADPLAERGGFNLYGFVGNNPANHIDLLGYSILGDFLANDFEADDLADGANKRTDQADLFVEPRALVDLIIPHPKENYKQANAQFATAANPTCSTHIRVSAAIAGTSVVILGVVELVPGGGAISKPAKKILLNAGEQTIAKETVEKVAAEAAEKLGVKNPNVRWVDEAASMSAEARAYQSGAAGARTSVATKKPQAPEITYKKPNGSEGALRMDGQEAIQLIDRKISVTTFPKSKQQALRQSQALEQNGLTGVWEVPNAAEVARAQKMFNELGIKNIEVRVVSK